MNSESTTSGTYATAWGLPATGGNFPIEKVATQCASITRRATTTRQNEQALKTTIFHWNTLDDRYNKMNFALSNLLPLAGGFHVGPLFVPKKQRPLVRPKGKEGVIHRAQTKRATPAWADLCAIAAVYKEARRLTRETGELHVVDHIVPKINPIVCGLHVDWNLRVTHWLENAKKGNAYWPDMPFEQMVLL